MKKILTIIALIILSYSLSYLLAYSAVLFVGGPEYSYLVKEDKFIRFIVWYVGLAISIGTLTPYILYLTNKPYHKIKF